MIFETADGKIEKLEKKIKRLETSVKVLQDSFDTITEVVKKMQETNSLLKENYRALGKTRNRLKEMDNQERKIDAKSVKQLYLPIKEKIKENVDFIKEIASEGIKNSGSDENEISGIKSVKMLTEDDMLIFLRNGTISSDELAHKLHVHRAQIEAWASKLQKKNVAETKTSGKKLFIKLKRS